MILFVFSKCCLSLVGFILSGDRLLPQSRHFVAFSDTCKNILKKTVFLLVSIFPFFCWLLLTASLCFDRLKCMNASSCRLSSHKNTAVNQDASAQILSYTVFYFNSIIFKKVKKMWCLNYKLNTDSAQRTNSVGSEMLFVS